MTQLLAILLDAYRELNARKLFWITMIFTGLTVLLVGGVGVSPKGYTFFGYLMFPANNASSTTTPAELYQHSFVDYGVGVWLSEYAIILALISTASIFPDFIAGGAIDLYLSKPIGRIKLFCFKYISGLLFVALQVAVFCLAAFLVIGIRGGVWWWQIFLAIPIIVLMFSYLFSFSVLLGVSTRSTIVSILLVMVFWGILSVSDRVKVQLSTIQLLADQSGPVIDARIAALHEILDASPTTAPTTMPQDGAALRRGAMIGRAPLTPNTRLEYESNLSRLEQERADYDDTPGRWSRRLDNLTFFLPQTKETSDLLERQLALPPDPNNDDVFDPDQPVQINRNQLNRDQQIVQRQRPASSIIGWSLVFELSTLAFAGLIFCRRDY